MFSVQCVSALIEFNVLKPVFRMLVSPVLNNCVCLHKCFVWGEDQCFELTAHRSTVQEKLRMPGLDAISCLFKKINK